MFLAGVGNVLEIIDVIELIMWPKLVVFAREFIPIVNRRQNQTDRATFLMQFMESKTTGIIFSR